MLHKTTTSGSAPSGFLMEVFLNTQIIPGEQIKTSLPLLWPNYIALQLMQAQKHVLLLRNLCLTAHNMHLFLEKKIWNYYLMLSSYD